MVLNVKLTKEQWRPTKYEKYRGKWRGKRHLTVGSRIVEDLQIEAYERVIQQYCKGRLIDIGCGNAPLAGIYLPLSKDITWADWSESADRQIFQLDYEVDLNGLLPFSDAEFDTILLSDVLEHIAEPDTLVRELARIAAPGAKIVIGVPFLYSVHEKPHDYHRYTRYKLEQFARKNNLLVIELEEIGGALDVWGDLTCKLCELVWQPLGRLPYAMWLALRRLPRVAKLNAKSAVKFPLAYIAVFGKGADGT